MGTRATEGMVPVCCVAVEGEPDLLRDAVQPRLHPHHEFAREEAATSLVEQDGVDPISEGEVHASGDEDLVPPVGVEVDDSRRPGLIRFDAVVYGNLIVD